MITMLQQAFLVVYSQKLALLQVQQQAVSMVLSKMTLHSLLLLQHLLQVLALFRVLQTTTNNMILTLTHSQFQELATQ